MEDPPRAKEKPQTVFLISITLTRDEKVFTELPIITISPQKIRRCLISSNSSNHVRRFVGACVRLKTYLCSHVGKSMSRIFTITADPTTPITTTHMTKKKRGRDSDQKRLRRSLTSSTHRHMACREVDVD